MRKLIYPAIDIKYAIEISAEDLYSFCEKFKEVISNEVTNTLNASLNLGLNPILKNINLVVDTDSSGYGDDTYATVTLHLTIERDLTKAEIESEEKYRIAAAKKAEQNKLAKKLKKQKLEAEEKALYEKLKAKYEN